MNISHSWALKNSSFQLNSSDPSFNTLFSPDAKLICCANRKNLQFFDENSTKTLKINLGTDENIQCIETISSDPWVIVAGTNFGRLHFFTLKGEIFQINVFMKEIKKVKLCNYKTSQFTLYNPLLLIQTPPNKFAIIRYEHIQKKISNPKDSTTIPIEKWSAGEFFLDGVLVSSSFTAPIASVNSQFPLFFSISNSSIDPFFSVYSISKTKPQSSMDFVKSAFKGIRNLFYENPEPEEKFETAKLQYTLSDEGRIPKSIDCDPTGRWIAICDGQGRVIIFDSIFGHIVKILKGLRDAQVSWSESTNGESILVIYAPFRRMIIACTAPKGEIIDAIKAEAGGRLFQVNTPHFVSAFIDSTKYISVDLKLKIPNLFFIEHFLSKKSPIALLKV